MLDLGFESFKCQSEQEKYYLSQPTKNCEIFFLSQFDNAYKNINFFWFTDKGFHAMMFHNFDERLC